ncbi:hypothetical protein WJX84_001463 [Apatococcus fuscideae]|uniref:Uncharacterized protein n=1 Tax=Apatococcus fuscideae TaxID=2026836 RepID=A0AAW1T2E2_9CHLO
MSKLVRVLLSPLEAPAAGVSAAPPSGQSSGSGLGTGAIVGIAGGLGVKRFQTDSDSLRAAANPLLNRRAPASVKTLGYGSPVWTRPIHKANSWSGVVVPVGVPARAAPRHRRMPSTIAAGLPPLRPLGAPITLSSPQAAGIDLNIDYETEIKPFIGRKLVR